MDITLSVVLLLLGFVGSFFSGMLGIGGAIINFPLLMYVPPLAGEASFTPHEVASISMFQVFFASLAGVVAYWRRKSPTAGTIHRGLVVYMGSGILAGSLIGGGLSGAMNGDAINLVYAVLAVAAVVLMLVPNRGREGEREGPLSFNKPAAVISSFAVGIVSGIVGAGGSFILIPIMLTVLRIPTRTTIASSLAIVLISAAGGVAGKLTGGAIPLGPTLFAVIGSLIGAPLGSRVGARINVSVLRYALLALIALTAVKAWASIL